MRDPSQLAPPHGCLDGISQGDVNIMLNELIEQLIRRQLRNMSEDIGAARQARDAPAWGESGAPLKRASPGAAKPADKSAAVLLLRSQSW